MWQQNLDKIIKEKQEYGEEINKGVPSAELESFIKQVKQEFGISLPDGYLDILRRVNGIEFNGYILYGIDKDNLRHRVSGFIELNRIWHDNEEQKKYVFFGEGNISWYVYDKKFMKYYELDNPSSRIICEFDNDNDMLQKLLTDALE